MENMERKAVSSIALMLLLSSMLTSAFIIQPVKAEPGTIYIRADGSVDPPTAPIQLDGSIYTFTGNITDSIVVQRDNIAIDGAGYTVQGTGSGHGIDLSYRNNVTVKNMHIENFARGVFLYHSSNNRISGNNITANNYYGIELWESSNNSISGNNITANNYYGIELWESSNNSISGNNITASNWDGISLYWESSYNSISGNSFVNNGLSVWDSYENTVIDNQVNGKPLVYLEGASDIVVWEAGQVVLVRCTRIRVENLNLSSASIGVELWQTNNTEISGNNIANNWYGIELWESSNNSISGNNITANNWYGIELYDSSNNSISGNNIANNGYGIELYDSSNNSISGNNITASNRDGISLYWESSNNSVSGNNITANNWAGIELWESSNNSISGNNIANNWAGISLYWESSYNLIYHNNFVDNTKQVDIATSATGYANVWDDGYPSGGNYWDDYIDVDEKSGPNQDQPGSDGIWDHPYVINSNNQDRYPLTPQDTTPPTTSTDYDGLWHTTDFIITLTATDDMSGVAETYYKINDGPTKTVTIDGQPLITTEGANNKLEYWSKDNAGNEESHHILTGIKLDKTAPTGSITINNDATYTTSASVTLTLTANDATSGVYQVRYSNDGVWDTEPWEPFSTTKSWTLTLGDGTKTVYYQIKDNAGLTSLSYQDSIILDTTKPTANAGVDQTANEDTLVTLDASASIDENGIATYTWTFTDITPQTLTGKNPTYNFATPGTYTITLVVTDPAGNSATDTLIITVLDVTKPVADAGQNQTANVGATVTFDASASTDNMGIISYEWDFGDGTTGTGKTATHTYTSSGNYTVTLTVKDAAGNTATHSITITVEAPPFEAFPMWIVGVAVAIIAIAAAAAFLWRRQK